MDDDLLILLIPCIFLFGFIFMFVIGIFYTNLEKNKAEEFCYCKGFSEAKPYEDTVKCYNNVFTPEEGVKQIGRHYLIEHVKMGCE